MFSPSVKCEFFGNTGTTMSFQIPIINDSHIGRSQQKSNVNQSP